MVQGACKIEQEVFLLPIGLTTHFHSSVAQTALTHNWSSYSCQRVLKNVMTSKWKPPLALSLPESVTETFKVVQTFEPVDAILWCDHSNKTSSAVLSHGTIRFVGFEKVKFRIFLKILLWPLLGVKGIRYSR